jgi:sugar/nucleoside kinase (ribokinase family)
LQRLHLDKRGTTVIDGVFVGLSTIDVIYHVQDFPAANAKVAARSQKLIVGGPATNAAITFSRLGGRATLVAAVGRHPFAGIIRDELERFGVQLIDLSPDFKDAPAISSIAVDDAGRRNVISANAAPIDIPPAAVDRRVCEQARILLVDGHAMQACQAWAGAAKELGGPVVFDGGSWKDGTEELLKSVHTAICSADFAPPECKSKRELVRFLWGRGVGNVALTHGAEPVLFFTEEKAGEVPVPQVEAIDTVGAGDIFHGAFCYFYAAGKSFEAALEAAAGIAAESCRYHGTREWMEHFSSGRGGAGAIN